MLIAWEMQRFDLIFCFTKISSWVGSKTVYIKVCEVTNSYVDILHYSAHDTLLMLGTYCVLDNSASEQYCITRYLITGSLGTWTLIHSALDNARHLNSLVHSALGITWHLNALFTRHLTSLGTWSCWIIRHLNKTELFGTFYDSAPSRCSAYIQNWLSVWHSIVKLSL